MQPGLNRIGAFAAIMVAAMLCGCANPEVFDANERWFSKPFDWTGKQGGFTFSELKETNESKRPVAANDLVSANGACPPPAAAAVAAAPPPAAAAGAPTAITADAAAPSVLGEGIALGMTECDVVWRAGAPSSVQIGDSPKGDRTATLTFNTGSRAGIYHFRGGRLTDMDRADVPAAAPKLAKRARAKKQPVRSQGEKVSTE